MSVQAISWVFECSESESGYRLVMLAIANHTDARGENAWPAIATIAREARLSDRQVQRALPRLVRLGELEVVYRSGRHLTNQYRLPKMAQSSLFAQPVEKTVEKRLRKRGVTICHP
ncbi:hypothetical protein LCGC14_2125860 [marine sediment metagenome]|uniref:Helix-turn-helix domain-containing protein n=1 Tax=marine sediment metagenome TaxID=412755 RepID=A0A0F9E2Y1_9ZZZZ